MVQWLLFASNKSGSGVFVSREAIIAAQSAKIRHRLLPSKHIVLMTGAVEITPPSRYVWNVDPTRHPPQKRSAYHPIMFHIMVNVQVTTRPPECSAVVGLWI